MENENIKKKKAPFIITIIACAIGGIILGTLFGNFLINGLF